ARFAAAAGVSTAPFAATSGTAITGSCGIDDGNCCPATDLTAAAVGNELTCAGNVASGTERGGVNATGLARQSRRKVADDDRDREGTSSWNIAEFCDERFDGPFGMRREMNLRFLGGDEAVVHDFQVDLRDFGCDVSEIDQRWFDCDNRHRNECFKDGFE